MESESLQEHWSMYHAYITVCIHHCTTCGSLFYIPQREKSYFTDPSRKKQDFSPCLATTQPMKKLLQLCRWEAAIHKVLLFSSKLSFKTVQFPPFLCKRRLSLFASQTCLWQTRVCLKLWFLCCVRVCVCVKSLWFVSDSLKHYGL